MVEAPPRQRPCRAGAKSGSTKEERALQATLRWGCLVSTICTKESSTLNLAMTVFHIIFFGFIIAAGFYTGNPKNLITPKGLAPFGTRGILDGAAVVYFSYIGYDSVSTMAEEIKNPSKSLPIGIAGSVLIVSMLYSLISVALCYMMPYSKIPERASFSLPFEMKVSWKWAGKLMGGGASLGIVASLLVAMLGQARYLCVIARARLAPLWLAKVHPSTGTPMNATIFLGVCTAAIALFTDLEIVIEIISIGTLLVFFMVANALIYRRYTDSHFSTLRFLLLLTLTSIGFSLSWKLKDKYWWGLALFGVASIAITAHFRRKAPYCRGPGAWAVPLMPWPAAASIFLNVFLMTSLKKRAFQRFGVCSCVIILFYLLYGVHSTYNAEEEEGVGIEMEANLGDESIDQATQQSKFSSPHQRSFEVDIP